MSMTWLLTHAEVRLGSDDDAHLVAEAVTVGTCPTVTLTVRDSRDSGGEIWSSFALQEPQIEALVEMMNAARAVASEGEASEGDPLA